MTGWLIDKSALVNLSKSPDAEQWLERIGRGLVSITTPTRLEIGYSARSASELRRQDQDGLLSHLPLIYLTPGIENRAFEVLTLLAGRGQHRAPSLPALLIAAGAELSELTVLHVDKDFALIAEITGQPEERLRV